MNLHGLVAGAVGVINPHILVTFQASAGYTTDGMGRRTPKYELCVDVSAQVQELTTRDLRQLDGLNVAGSTRKIYLFGIAKGTVRVSRSGGDLITLPSSGVCQGEVYLTTAVLEQWPDWVAVAVTLQNGS